MRRLFAVCISLLLFVLAGTAIAAPALSACETALSMAQEIPEMVNVHEAVLSDMPNRAIWTDSRTDGKCALTVYEDAGAAESAAVLHGTPDTSARTVGLCLLALDSDLSSSVIEEYVQVLYDVTGIRADESGPDYILNVNTKKFHYPECSSVEDMKESNKQPYTGERDELISQGYKACKRCYP